MKYPQNVANAAEKGIIINTVQCGSRAMPGPVAADRGDGPRAILQRRSGRQRRRDRDAVRRGDRDACRPSSTRHGSTTARPRSKALRRPKSVRPKTHEEASVAARARRGAFNASEAGASNSSARRTRLRTSRAVASTSRPSRPRNSPRPSRRFRSRRGALCSPTPRRSARNCNGRSFARRGTRRVYRGRDRGRRRRRDSLDQQIYEAVREQAAPLGLDYEDGPSF